MTAASDAAGVAPWGSRIAQLMDRYKVILLVALPAALISNGCKRTLPFTPTTQDMTVLGMWDEAPFVVTAELKGNPRKLFGTAMPNVNPPVTVYACEGELNIEYVLKGTGRKPKEKVVWFTPMSACPSPMTSGVRSVWFLRFEPGFLRPVTDATRPYIELPNTPATWGAATLTPVKDPERKLGEALLQFASLPVDTSVFPTRFASVAPLACVLLGDVMCLSRIKQLQKTAQPAFKSAIWVFLATRYRQCYLGSCAGREADYAKERAWDQSGRERMLRQLHGSKNEIISSVGAHSVEDAVSKIRLYACDRDAEIRQAARVGLHRIFHYFEDPSTLCVPCDDAQGTDHDSDR
jgi:hypothetical protein